MPQIAIPQEGIDRVFTLLTTNLTHIAIGTGTNSVKMSDTQLQTEIARVGTEAFSLTRIGHIAIIEAFFTDTQLGGSTIKEVGGFMNGTGAANSGSLLFRVLKDGSVSGTRDLLYRIVIPLRRL